MFPNLRIKATNAYLKDLGVTVDQLKDHSSTFFTVEQYASVSDSILIL
jgi:hypothetical protein